MGSGGWDNSRSYVIANERTIMPNERAKEVARLCWPSICLCSTTAKNPDPGWVNAIAQTLASLPEFQEPKSEWIKCSDRLPELDQSMWWFVPGEYSTVNHGRYGGPGCLPPHAFWKPVALPKPPEPEDSELITSLKRLSSTPNLGDVLLIVRAHERAPGYEKGK